MVKTHSFHSIYIPPVTVSVYSPIHIYIGGITVSSCVRIKDLSSLETAFSVFYYLRFTY